VVRMAADQFEALPYHFHTASDRHTPNALRADWGWDAGTTATMPRSGELIAIGC
jgi:hypothetical protein